MTRPLVFGILNVTPDSFSDGGCLADAAAAVAHASEMRAQGADVIDVGGESTRPGALRVPEAEEHERVLPIIGELVARGMRVSVDTVNASTARAAADRGAEFVNDVSGGLADPLMYDAVAATGVRYIAMHWRGHSDTMQDRAQYHDVVAEVRAELGERIAEMTSRGIDPSRVAIDPGLGFAKTAEHNWSLLARLDELAALGLPMLVGASRKGFLAEFAPGGSAPQARDEATAFVSALAAQAGVWALRVHHIPSTMRALAVAERWHNGAKP